MDLGDFRNDIIQTVRSRAAAEKDFLLSAFVEEAASRLADADELADFVPCHFRGTGSRQRHVGVDGYAFDESDTCLRVLIASWSGARSANPHPGRCDQTIRTGSQFPGGRVFRKARRD